MKKNILIFLTLIVCLPSFSSNSRKEQSPEEVAKRYTKALLSFELKDIDCVQPHLGEIYTWAGIWRSHFLMSADDVFSSQWKSSITAKVVAKTDNDSTINPLGLGSVPIGYNSCIVEVYVKDKDSVGNTYDMLLWNLKLVKPLYNHERSETINWDVYENFGGKLGITRNTPEEAALNFMNNLIDLEIDEAGNLKAEKYASDQMIYSCAWGDIEFYAFNPHQLGLSDTRDYDLIKLRKHREEGYKLYVFKTEIYKEDSNYFVIWMDHVKGSDKRDSGRVLVKKEDLDWKVTGYNF